MRNLALFFIALGNVCPAWAAPSFNCEAAKSNVEKTICRNAELSQLDVELASAFKSAKEAASVTASQQTAWLKRRDAECDTQDSLECLRRLLRERISELNMPASKSKSVVLKKSNLFPANATNLPIIWLDAETIAFIGGPTPETEHRSATLFIWEIEREPTAHITDLDVYTTGAELTSLRDGSGILRLRRAAEDLNEGKIDLYFYFNRKSAHAIDAAEYERHSAKQSTEIARERKLSVQAIELASKVGTIESGISLSDGGVDPGNSGSIHFFNGKSKALVWNDPTYFIDTSNENISTWRRTNCWPFYEVDFAAESAHKRCVPYGNWSYALIYPLPTASGTFIIATAFNYMSWESSAFGIYQIVGGEVQNIYPGEFIPEWSVSPDGCKVALVHQPGEPINALATPSTVDIWNVCASN